jgi:hypothetical protein
MSSGLPKTQCAIEPVFVAPAGMLFSDFPMAEFAVMT